MDIYSSFEVHTDATLDAWEAALEAWEEQLLVSAQSTGFTAF